MRRVSRFAFVLAAAALAACGGSATSPDRPAPVAVTVQPTPTFVGGPDSAAFTMRVDNTSASVVDLTFPSSCQVLPYFIDRRTAQAVTPRGGGFVCLTVITSRRLTAGESFAQTVAIKMGDVPLSGFVVLPAGDYAIYARLEDQTYRAQSDPVVFSLK